MKCTYCGGEDLEQGFVQDLGQSARGFAEWVAGGLERGFFGGAKRMGRRRWEIDAYRCKQCSHLELFANRPS